MSEIKRCRYATPTERPWQPNMKCKVIECRCGKLPNTTDKNFMHCRYPIHKGKVDRNAGYLEVRSKYCDAPYCSSYES